MRLLMLTVLVPSDSFMEMPPRKKKVEQPTDIERAIKGIKKKPLTLIEIVMLIFAGIAMLATVASGIAAIIAAIK